MRQYFVVTPFASLGDQTTFPIATDPNGNVSFQQGWGPDYAADPATNANAKDIDRAATNWLMYIVTNALSAIQGETIPEWITAADNNGTAFQYGKGACVLYSAAGTPPYTVYRSLVDANVSTPGADNNWQVEIYQAAAAADVVAGTSNALIVTPLALKSYPGNSAQAFNVGTATTLTHAPTTQQVQRSGFNYAGVAGGSANALSATLAPAPTAYTDDLVVVVRVAANNTGAVTLNVNSIGALAVIGSAHQALQGGELVAGGFACFRYSSNYNEFILEWTSGGGAQVGTAVASAQAAQLAQLLAVSGPQAILSYTNANTITLSRFRTGYVYSPGYGNVVQIPSGGLTLTAVGLTAGALYYIYLNPNGGAPTLISSTTTHQADSTGVEVMSGDNTKVLVGMAYAVTATSWLSVVRSWVHDKGLALTAVLGTTSSTNSTVANNINTGLQISFLAWSNELASFTVNAGCSVNSTNTNIATFIALNNATIAGAVATTTPATTNAVSQTVSINSQSVTEGLNTVNMFGSVGSSSAVATWYANQTATNVSIAPRA